MIRWVLLLAALCHPDILIGGKPCLWKRAVTERRVLVPTGGFDTLWLDKRGYVWYNEKCKDCQAYEFQEATRWRTDTTGWETYWDSCERGKK